MFAQLESIDNGKSVAVAKAVDVTWAAEIFYYYAGWATKIEGRTIPVSVPWAPGAGSTPSPLVNRSVCAHRSSRGTSRW